jgi:hypothetical protein
VNIVTKSGGNEFKGTFKFFMRSSRLDGDGAGTDAAELRGGLGESEGFRDRKFTDLYPFLSVSGALIKNHLWYYLAPEFIQIEEPINSGTQAYVAATRAVRVMGKVTWQVASANRLDFVALYDDTHLDNQGLTSRTALESGYAVGRGGPTLTLQDTAILSPAFSLETTVSRFDQSFAVTPTLDADTNGNGLLFTDRIPGLGNNDGFLNLRERDPGEDYDRDGRYDIFEDLDGNGRLDGCLRDPTTGKRVCFPPEGAVAPWDGLLHFGEDRDRDGRLTLSNGCEGKDHEDLNCNGLIDAEVDLNRNGIADSNEDKGILCQDRVFCPDGYEPGTRGNGVLDTEDRNGDGTLNTMPGAGATSFPLWTDKDGDGIHDPGEFHAPLPRDRDYLLSVDTNRTSGPYYTDYRDSRTRNTLKEEFSAYAGDLMGSHDMKMGVIFEKEGFDRTTRQRPFLQITPPAGNLFTFVPGKVGVFLPTQTTVENTAASDHLGFYVQDSYKPLPSLALGLGLRFDREVVRSDGYESFDPASERRAFDAVTALRGIEATSGDLNGDGVIERGFQSDPLYSPQDSYWAGLESTLAEIAPRRLTRHNFLTSIESSRLGRLGISDPNLLLNGHPRQPEEIEISNNNLAPRLSVSWDPRNDGKSKVFASWGRYYGNLFLETVVGEQGPDTISPYYVYDQDGVNQFGLPDNQAGRVISYPPPSAYQVDRGLRTPFTDELTAGIYREIAPEVSVSLTYVRRDYRDQLQDVDVNHSTRRAPHCGTTTPAGYCDDFGGTVPPLSGDPAPGPAPIQTISDGYPDLFINNFNFNQIFRVGNYNVQDYSSYEVQLTRRLRRKWQLDASYVYSKATGQAESFHSESGNDPALTELKSGYLAYDQRHVAKFHAVAFLPSDWQIGGALTWSSGLPYSFVNRAPSTDNVVYSQTRRLFGRRDLNTGKFFPEQRNAHRNHAVYDINVRGQKNFVIGHVSAGAFFEVFNLLNTDDLRISEIDNFVNSLQAEETRRFGRRFQFGVQMDF